MGALSTTSKTVTIAAGGTVSTAVDLEGKPLLQIIMPAAWTAANLNVQSSHDPLGGFVTLYNDNGTLVTIVVAAANTGIGIEQNALAMSACKHMKLVSTVAQAAERVIRLILKD